MAAGSAAHAIARQRRFSDKPISRFRHQSAIALNLVHPINDEDIRIFRPPRTSKNYWFGVKVQFSAICDGNGVFDWMIVLLEFGLRNFCSFREGATISFKLDANCPTSISRGKDIGNLLGIKGANASGKTQILKAFSFLANFCTSSFKADPDAEIPISSFFGNAEPSEFFAEFKVNDITYTYELSCTDKEVVTEIIYQKKAKKVKVLERKLNEVTFTTHQFQKLKGVKLRKNASIVSTARQYELIELGPIYHFFDIVISNVGFSGLRERPFDIRTVSKFLQGNTSALDFVQTFISECDVGISSIQIAKSTGADNKDEFFPIFLHKFNDAEQPITRHEESSGTKELFRILPLYKAVLVNGGVLVLDEFDVHLHPHILPKLLNLFLDDTTNPNNAQLLFTTHDSEIFDLLGRYRVYLTNKRQNESFAFRLDEIPGEILRNDRPILPAYQDGKIGGVPRI